MTYPASCFLLLGLFLACVMLSGCGSSGGRLLVFAASSLTDSMQQLAQEYEEKTGVRVDLSFGASSRLAQQISRGAPADVMISAGTHPVDRLEDEGLVVEGSRRALLTNRLVLAVRADDAESVSNLQELGEAEGMLAIADPDFAPAGVYAREALIRLGLWEAFEPLLVYGANVRTTLGYVESGNVEAALVYQTDAFVSEGVAVVEMLPEGVHAPIVYPAVALTRTDDADFFVDFLASAEASEVFRRMGFETVESR